MEPKLSYRNRRRYHSDLVDNPDISLIFMDIRMPGMNGIEATLKIREFNADVLIIAYTALMLNDEKKKAMEAGCNNYILKPIDQDLLLQKIKQLVIRLELAKARI